MIGILAKNEINTYNWILGDFTKNVIIKTNKNVHVCSSSSGLNDWFGVETLVHLDISIPYEAFSDVHPNNTHYFSKILDNSFCNTSIALKTQLYSVVGDLSVQSVEVHVPCDAIMRYEVDGILLNSSNCSSLLTPSDTVKKVWSCTYCHADNLSAFHYCCRCGAPRFESYIGEWACLYCLAPVKLGEPTCPQCGATRT